MFISEARVIGAEGLVVCMFLECLKYVLIPVKGKQEVGVFGSQGTEGSGGVFSEVMLSDQTKSGFWSWWRQWGLGAGDTTHLCPAACGLRT